MKLHIGVDAQTGLVHRFATTPANVHDVTQAHRLLHGGELRVWGDAGYVGVQKRAENLGLAVDWRVAMRPGQRCKLEPGTLAAWAERVKASIRAKVEHPFRDVKRVFGYAKSLPSSPIGGPLPGVGKEHGTAGLAAGPVQPEESPTLAGGRLTQGVMGPGPGQSRKGSRSRVQKSRIRAKSEGGRPFQSTA